MKIQEVFQGLVQQWTKPSFMHKISNETGNVMLKELFEEFVLTCKKELYELPSDVVTPLLLIGTSNELPNKTYCEILESSPLNAEDSYHLNMLGKKFKMNATTVMMIRSYNDRVLGDIIDMTALDENDTAYSISYKLIRDSLGNIVASDTPLKDASSDGLIFLKAFMLGNKKRTSKKVKKSIKERRLETSTINIDNEILAKIPLNNTITVVDKTDGSLRFKWLGSVFVINIEDLSVFEFVDDRLEYTPTASKLQNTIRV